MARPSISTEPPSARGTPAYRFNWNAPLVLSRHAPHVLYYGGNHVFRSDTRGNNWARISPDLTRGRPGPRRGTRTFSSTGSNCGESPRCPAVTTIAMGF